MNIQEIKKIIDDFGISMPKLANKIGVNISSFKKKIEPSKYNGYKFTDEELKNLESAVLELMSRLESV